MKRLQYDFRLRARAMVGLRPPRLETRASRPRIAIGGPDEDLPCGLPPSHKVAAKSGQSPATAQSRKSRRGRERVACGIACAIQTRAQSNIVHEKHPQGFAEREVNSIGSWWSTLEKDQKKDILNRSENWPIPSISPCS